MSIVHPDRQPNNSPKIRSSHSGLLPRASGRRNGPSSGHSWGRFRPPGAIWGTAASRLTGKVPHLFPNYAWPALRICGTAPTLC
jgi:hypothetical protein